MDSVKRFYCSMYEKSVISKLCKVPPICAYSVCPNYGFVFYVTVYIYLKLCQFILALLVYTACLPFCVQNILTVLSTLNIITVTVYPNCA